MSQPGVADGLFLHAAAAGLEARPAAAMPTHDPPLAPRDEATFLLHIAAEIEHALMVQYLYAAYSLNPDAAGLSGAQRDQVQGWKDVILGIAKEEMAHFISVQNILISLGAPLNFGREDYPFRSDFYPFPFALEPLTIKRPEVIAAALSGPHSSEFVARTLFSASLNRYIAAEMPDIGAIAPGDRDLVAKLTHGLQVNRVGRLFERILDLFDAGLEDADFDGDRVEAQAAPREWGGTGIGGGRFAPLVRPIATRAEARRLLAEIAEQGEGHEQGPEASHFQRFLAIYRELEDFDPALVYLHNVPSSPTTAVNLGAGTTPITEPRSRSWAQVLNLRYRLLLEFLWHFLSTSGPLFTANGDRTPHGWLVIAVFHEMSHVKSLSELLVCLDLDAAGSSLKAGPPFELPYALALPERERDRWRRHLDALAAVGKLLTDLSSTANPASPTNAQEQAILAALSERDTAARAELERLRDGQPLQSPQGFAKVERILSEGLRGFPLQEIAHNQFWQVDEAHFLIVEPLPGMRAITPGDGANSMLVNVLKNPVFGEVMPLGRAPLDVSRIAFIEQWIDGLPAGPVAAKQDTAANGSAPMGRYQEVIDILDGAVGGSTVQIGAHQAFWRGKTKAQFVAASVFGQKLLLPGDGKNSRLVQALRGEAPFGSDMGVAGAIFRRMPAGRPGVAAQKVAVIEKWIDDGCPD